MAVTLNDTQRANAQTIVDVGRSLGATTEEIIGALSAAWSESKLNNKVSVVDTNGKLSVGLFQQQDSYGTIAVRMDPVASAKAFITRLIGTRGGQSGLQPNALPIGTRVANVQRPAAQYRGMYQANLPTATDIFQQLSVGSTTSAPHWGQPIFPKDGSGAATDGGFGVPPAAGGSGAAASANGQTIPGSPYAAGILKGLDDLLNARQGTRHDAIPAIGDVAISAIARAGVVVAGVVVATFGFVLIVSSIGKASGATKVAKMVPGPVGAAATVADATDGNEAA